MNTEKNSFSNIPRNNLGLVAGLLAIAIIFGCQPARSQSAPSDAGTAPATFVTSVQKYFTGINTNYTFDNVTLEMSTGYKQVNGVNASSELYAQYDVTPAVDVMGNLQFSGIGSAINAAELGVGYAIIHHFDTKVQADLLCGWDATKSETLNGVRQGALVVEPRLALKKKLTPNTYAETAVSLPVYTIGKLNSQPSFYMGVGFTY
jgi:Flp pilus assembly pilin Flp